MKKIKRDCLFQYATRQKIYEDTDLITRDEADELWDKYKSSIRSNWDEFSSPQMCIWIKCKDNTDYHTVGREIDFRDCELENDEFYKIKKEKV